jgi:hypothetical protein
VTDTPAPAAWTRLLAQLDQAAAIVTGPLGARTARERAEGMRHITRVLSIASEMLLEKGDVARPAFTCWMSPQRKMLGDNPGTIYDAAMIDPTLTYRISGDRGSCAYLGVCVYGTAADGARRVVGNIDDDELAVAPDGSFELWLAPQRPPDAVSFLPLQADATDVMVRQYFVAPENEVPATYTIEAVPGAGPPPPLTEEVLAARLDAVGAFVRDIVEAEATLSALIASITPSTLRGGSEFVDAEGKPTDPPIDPAAVARVMPSPSIDYAGSWFDDLADDEAIVVEGRAPVCRYWSVQLLSRWMESGDYRHHPVALTGREIAVDADGTFRIVVAHRDPGVPNWLATTGLRAGSIAVRALRAEGGLEIHFTRSPLPLG